MLSLRQTEKAGYLELHDIIIKIFKGAAIKTNNVINCFYITRNYQTCAQ